MENRRILPGICDSLRNHVAILEQLVALCEHNDVTIVVNENVHTCPARFSDEDIFLGKVKDVIKHDIIHTTMKTEKVGSANAYGMMMAVPITAIATAKMVHGIYDRPTILSTKAMIRNQRNTVFSTVTSDGLGISRVNIFPLINTRHFYIIPFRQDVPSSKKRSTVSDRELMERAMDQALNDRQLQPTLLGGR